jgi:hypothetical protein
MQYTVPSIAVQDLVPGTYVDRDTYNFTTRIISLANGCAGSTSGLARVGDAWSAALECCPMLLCSITEFVADARQVYSLDNNDISPADRTTFWVGANTLFHTMRTSMQGAFSTFTILHVSSLPLPIE